MLHLKFVSLYGMIASMINLYSVSTRCPLSSAAKITGTADRIARKGVTSRLDYAMKNEPTLLLDELSTFPPTEDMTENRPVKSKSRKVRSKHATKSNTKKANKIRNKNNRPVQAPPPKEEGIVVMASPDPSLMYQVNSTLPPGALLDAFLDQTNSLDDIVYSPSNTTTLKNATHIEKYIFVSVKT